MFNRTKEAVIPGSRLDGVLKTMFFCVHFIKVSRGAESWVAARQTSLTKRRESVWDQLLMIRLAQQLGAAPDIMRGGEVRQISNQRPIAEKAESALFRGTSPFCSLLCWRHSSPFLRGSLGIVHGGWDDCDSHECDGDSV